MADAVDAILVVGGYGTIGRTVCTDLAGATTAEVVAAGRSLERARRFADTVEGIRPGVVDVADPDTYDDALDGVGTVVVCLDQDGPVFARRCLERGIDYVDVSPTDALLREIEALDDVARENDATAVLGVGLSPGLTTLFTADAIGALDAVDRVDVTLLLGLGEAFGPDTIRWTVEDASGEFTVREDGEQVRVEGFTDPRTVEIPGWGRRRAYRADLADQHLLARTTDVPTIASRLCYDSRLVTRYVAFLNRTGLARPLVSLLGAGRLARLLDRLPLGTDESVVQTTVTGTRDGRPTRVRRWLCGPDQARATALVAATVARSLRTATHPAGVYHIQERFEPAPFVERLEDAGYTLGSTTDGGDDR